MYGLKPVPFKLKPVLKPIPFKLKPVLKPVPFKLKPIPFKLTTADGLARRELCTDRLRGSGMGSKRGCGRLRRS